jgi:hypothetical protein
VYYSETEKDLKIQTLLYNLDHPQINTVTNRPMTSELSQAQVQLLCEAVPAKILTSLPRINKTGFFACPKFIVQCGSNLAGIEIQHDAEMCNINCII